MVVDRSQPAEAIKGELAELCRGADDLALILLSFRNKEWIRIGTRDILRREPIRDVTRELADVAEAVVAQVANDQWRRRVEKLGLPRRQVDGKPARWAILALGKLGGRELNYHSDLDLIFVYESAGATSGGPESVPNEQFFADVAKRSLKVLCGATRRPVGSTRSTPGSVPTDHPARSRSRSTRWSSISGGPRRSGSGWR